MAFPPVSRSARGRLARAVRGHAEKHVAQGRRDALYGVVRQVSPLQIELEGHRLILNEDHLVVTQWVRRYGYDFGLAVGDTVLVAHMPNDDFVVHDVVGTGKVENGLDLGNIVASADVTLTDPQGGAITQNHHVTKKVPFLDMDGATIGYVAIWGDLP